MGTEGIILSAHYSDFTERETFTPKASYPFTSKQIGFLLPGILLLKNNDFSPVSRCCNLVEQYMHPASTFHSRLHSREG